MNKRFMPDIHGAYKQQKNKKKQMSKESVINTMKSKGLDEKQIADLESQAYASQYAFGYKQYNQFLIDLDNTVTIINGKSFDIPRAVEKPVQNINSTLKAMAPLVTNINDHLKSKQSATGVIENALDVTFNFSNNPMRMSSSLASLMDNIKKFDANKEFMYFDTETFSGQNKFGQQTLLGMQEFSGTKYKRVNGKVEEIAGSKIEALFGLDKSSLTDINKINTINEWIEQYETTGQMPGHSLAEVTLKRLAVEGHDDTKLDFGKNGIVRVTSYASPEAMKGKELNIDLIKKGLAKELKVGEYQKTVGRVGADTLGNESITASTFEFFKYINELNNSFAMSKNGIHFDAKVIGQEAESRYNNLTANQRNYLSNYFGTKDFHKINFNSGHLDQEYLFRLGINAKGEKHYIPEERIKYIQNLGLTTGQLEGLGRAINEDGIYNLGKAAHTAGQDTFAGAYLAAGDYKDGKSLMEVMIDDITQMYGDGKSLEMANNVVKTKNGESLTPIFIATKSDQFESSPLDFTVDNLTGDIHFGNKQVMGVDGEIRSAMFAPATKANVAYEIKVNKINPTKEMLQEMQKAGDYFKGTDDLYLVSYIPQIDKELAQGNEALLTPIHRIMQGKDKVEASISNTFVYAFNKDAQGNYRELSVEDGVTETAIKHAQENLLVHTSENGKRVVKQTTANEKVTKGTFDLMNDSAAREMRNTDLKKAQSFINVRDTFRQQGYNTDKEIKDRIGEILSATVSKGKSLTLNEQDNLQLNQLLGMVGYTRNGSDKTLIHPGTFKNFYNTFDAFSSMGSTLDEVISLSSKGGLDADIRYKEYMKSLRENIAEAIVSDENVQSRFSTFMNGKGLGRTAEELVNGLSTVETYAFNDKFEFNISAKKFNFYSKNNIDAEDIFSMDLKAGKHYSFINNLMNRHYGVDRVKGMNSATKEALSKRAIVDFMKEINSTEEYQGIFDEVIKNVDKTDGLNSVSLAAEAQRAVKEFKNNNPMAGVSSKTNLMNVISDADLIAFANSFEEGVNIINRSIEESTKFLKNKKSKVVSGKAVDREAATIVDTVLNNVIIDNKKVSDINQIAKHAAEVYGYTEKNIALRVKHNRQEQINMVKSIINTVNSIEGGTVSYTNKGIGIKIGNSEVVDITKYLPVMSFDNGILTNTLNNSKLAAGEMISVADLLDHNGNLTTSESAIRSTLARGSRDLNYLKGRVRHKDTDSSKIDTIIYSLKKMGTNLRETSQVSVGNTFTEAIGSVRRLDMREVQLAIPALRSQIEKSDAISDKHKKVLLNNMERFKKLDSDAEYDQIAAEVEPIIAKMILGVTEDGQLNDNIDSHYLLNRYNLFVRDTSYAKFERAAGENDISAFQQLSNYKKPPIHQRRNAKLYRKEGIDEFVKNNREIDNTFNSVISKNRIVTKKEQKLTNRKLSDTINSTDTIMANRLDIDDKAFKERLSTFKKELIGKSKDGKLSKQQEAAFEILSSMNLFEQEKIVNSRIGEMLLQDNDTQFIKASSNIVNTLLNKEKDLEVANDLFKKQIKTIPIINVDKNGKVTFKYGNKQLVNKHETLFTKEGYGSSVETIGANFDGLLSFKYYSANVAVNEKEITDYLNSIKVTSPEEALDALNSKFTGMFAVENAVAKGMNKIYVDVEKGMGRSLAIGAGRINEDIATVLRRTGFSDKINTLIKDDFIRDGLGSIEGIERVLELSGFNGIEDFIKAVHTERHLANDLLEEAFGNKGIAIFTNDAKAKHESLDMAVKDFINTAAFKKVSDSNNYSEESWNKAYKEVYDTLKDSKAFSPFIEDFDSKTGQIITKSVKGTDYSLQLEDVRDVANKLGMVDGKGNIRFGIDNEYGGQIVHSAINVAGPGEYAGTSGSQGRLKAISEEISELRKKSHLSDYEETRLLALMREKDNAASRNKLLTIDHRASRTLDRQSYNVTNKLNRLESTLSNIALNDESNMFQHYFGDITERDSSGNVVLKDGVSHKTNAVLIDDLKEKARYNADLEYLGGGHKKLDSSYIQGLDPNDERHLIYEKFAGPDKAPISREYAELSHASVQSRHALQFNGQKGGVTEQQLLDSGFTNINIKDLVQPVGAGSADYVGQENVPVGKSFLLEMADKDGNISKIAVPYMPSKQVGDELINTELNSAVRSVSHAYNQLEDFRKRNLAGNATGNATEEQLQTYLDNSVDNLRTAIKNSAQGVEKQLNSVQLNQYKYNKASGMLYHKGKNILNSDFYSTAKFGGVSLGELADKGVYIPAAATGLDFFKDQGMLDESYYKKLGIDSREEMIKHLETNGVVGLLGRNPQTEDMSTSMVMVYLDRTRNSQEIKVTAEALLAKNGDFDGDNLTLALLEGGTNKQKMYEMQRGILADTVQLGAIRERLIDDPEKGKIFKESVEARSTFEDIFKKSAVGSGKDTFINMIDNNITADQVNEYRTITNGLINSIGKDTYRNYDFDQTFDALMKEARSTYAEGTDEYNKALEAINFSIAETKQAMANISNSAKKDIGYMDTPLTELENMADALGFTGDDAKAISSISKVMKEAPISKKHDASAELSITNRYRDAWKRAMTSGDEDAAQEIRDIMGGMKSAIVDRAMTTELAYSGLAEMSEDDAFATIMQSVDKILDAGKTLEGQQVFLSQKKINEANATAHSIQTNSSIFGEVIAELTEKEYIDETVLSNTASTRHTLTDDFISRKRMAQEAVKEISHGIKSVSGSGLAKAALGIAGAIMAAGYIGGNPTVAPGMEAQQMDEYDSLQDKDLQIQQLPQGTGQGYVININAQSDRGQQHAMEAIQKAMHSSVPTDINIAMNMTDKTSNINSRFIENLLAGAL